MNASTMQKVTRIMNSVSAGTSEQTSSSIDMQGYDGVEFFSAFGTIVSGAETSVKIATSTDDSSFSDLLGTSITVADDDDDGVTVHDIDRPLERYLRVVIPRATQNATIDGVIAIQYKSRKGATSDDSSTVIAREIHASPARGTA